jgi:membrane peptidoglycan carboxypeptidase
MRVVVALLAALCVVLVMGLAGGLGYELALPSVASAQAKVAAMVQTHYGQISALPVPAKLGAAVAAVEDDRFYSNVAVNVLYGIGRAALGTMRGSGDAGGSTIAQQLAKQLYGKGGGLGASVEELALGVKLSVSYPRAQVLNMYLNAAYYGNGYWGEVAAARGYFGVDPARLSWAEASMLAGLVQAPSAYDPLRHFALAKQRQRHVLDRLVATHYLTAPQASAAYRAPLDVRRSSVPMSLLRCIVCPQTGLV